VRKEFLDQSLMGKIFICYRRDDSIATAGRLRDTLVQTFGRRNVFVDVYDIPHGRDFLQILERKVAECDVFLAVIGPHWLNACDESGQRRLNDQDDFVGIEIASALKRESVAVIPILVDGADMPMSADLPTPLQPLVRRNAFELRNSQFGSDSERLIKSIKELMPRSHMRTALAVAASAAVMVGITTAVWWGWQPLTERAAKAPRELPIQIDATAKTGPDSAPMILAPDTQAAQASPFLPPLNASSSQRVALVIGNGKYENTVPLDSAAEDARAIAAKLRELGFMVALGKDLPLVEMAKMVQGTRHSTGWRKLPHSN
jgi:hypothetical protein